jgi:hypothetical protein
MNEPFSSLLPSAGALGVAALVALSLTLSRGAGNPDPVATRRTAGIALLAIALQSVHFVEELLAGLDARLPELFGFAPISKAFFVKGILHPLLSLATRSYFPGVWTAPVVGVFGLLLLRRLGLHTRRLATA